MKKILIVPLLFLAACQAPAPPAMDGGNTDANMVTMQRFYDEVINAHNPAMLDSFLAPEIVDHQSSPGYPDGVTGIDNLRGMFVEWFSSYPDLTMKANFMVASGDTVTAQITMTGTNSGPMGDMPATNKSIEVDGVDIVVFRDGLAVEHWGYMEDSKMMEQLGMMGGDAPADTMAIEGAEGLAPEEGMAEEGQAG